MSAGVATPPRLLVAVLAIRHFPDIHASSRFREPPAIRPWAVPRFSCDHAMGMAALKSGSPPGAGRGRSQSVICPLSSVIPHFLCRGSNASRRPSPRKFSASNVLAIAIAGKTNNHQ
jgi:hypothetical protein